MTPNPQKFVDEWIQAWNSHDLDMILSHYTEDFEMASPYIVQLMNDPAGTIKGKDKVRAYWRRGLDALPDLHFKLIRYYVGVGSIAVNYEGAQGKTVVEVFFFAPDGRVNRATSLYA